VEQTVVQSDKGIVWVGVAMFLFGLASIIYPPLKLLIGSMTTSVAIAIGGLALMIMPTLIVGNELLIICGVGVVVGGVSLFSATVSCKGAWEPIQMALRSSGARIG